MAFKRQLTWQIEENARGARVLLQGEVNELFEPQELLDDLSNISGQLVLDCAGVSRLSSEGVRRWINCLRELARLSDLTGIEYARCSIPVVSQFNMIPNFLEHAKVRSVYAPYVCRSTAEEQPRLLQLDDFDPEAPPQFPDDRGSCWILDDEPGCYFAWLIDQPEARASSARQAQQT